MQFFLHGFFIWNNTLILQDHFLTLQNQNSWIKIISNHRNNSLNL